MAKIKRKLKEKDIVFVSRWLENHPIYKGQFYGGLDIDYVIVDSKIKKIAEDKNKENTEVIVWIESSYPFIMTNVDQEGNLVRSTQNMLNTELMVGAETFEKALIKLGKQVLKNYGDYTKNEAEIAELLLYPDINGDWDLAREKNAELNRKAKKMVSNFKNKNKNKNKNKK